MYNKTRSTIEGVTTLRRKRMRALTNPFNYGDVSAYWMGWLSANTSIVDANTPQGERQFAVIYTDASEREHLAKCLKFLGDTDAINTTTKNTITHKSGPLAVVFKDLDMAKDRNQRDVPQPFVLNPNFWRGYMDANGHSGIVTKRLYPTDKEVTNHLFIAVQGNVNFTKHYLRFLYSVGIQEDGITVSEREIGVWNKAAYKLILAVTTGENIPRSIVFNRAFFENFDAMGYTEDDIPVT